jgi:hypothetical protein
MSEHGNYYWIVAQDPETRKPYLIFGDRDENQARQKAFEMLGGVDFELKSLPTRNLARASSLLKGHRLEDTHSLSKAGERLGHDKSLNRMRKRHRQLSQ